MVDDRVGAITGGGRRGKVDVVRLTERLTKAGETVCIGG